MSRVCRIGIIGASGYTGAELARLLLNHPHIELTYVTADRYRDQKAASLYPNLTGICDLSYTVFDSRQAKENSDLLFLALPHGTSMKIVPQLMDEDHKIIDLSGDFRLVDKTVYEKWYGIPHVYPALLGAAIYGLPEINRGAIKRANFVCNPGCYPTSVLLATAPLLTRKLIQTQSIVVDAKSGVSGAGRGLSLSSHFPECNENVKAYSVAAHKHTPEMEQEMSKLAGKEIKISFTPHLIPMTRGILSTIYCDLKRSLKTPDLLEIYGLFYEGEPFVHILREGEYPETKSILGSNHCHIGLEVDGRTRKVIVVCAIDNLIKGAAGQAIQNMNIMCGFSEDEGLRAVGLVP